MNKNLPAVFVLALLGLALAACGPQQQGAPSFGVWIDAPLDGSVLSPGVYQIIAHASSGLDITNLWISVSQWPNDSLVGTAIYGSNETTSINEGLALYTGDWAFNVPGKYYINVHANPDYPNPGAGTPTGSPFYALAVVTVCEQVLEGKCLPVALKLESETPAPVAIPDLIPIAIPSRDANCRLGPSSTFFDIADTLLMGMQYMPVAQGPDGHVAGKWLLFSGPATQTRCWVFIDNLDLFCNEVMVEISDISPCTLPVANYPPLPTATPEPEATETPRLPECRDGIDNDGDGDVDMADGRCTSPDDNSESS